MCVCVCSQDRVKYAKCLATYMSCVCVCVRAHVDMRRTTRSTPGRHSAI
jgi:hypothetical protein